MGQKPPDIMIPPKLVTFFCDDGPMMICIDTSTQENKDLQEAIDEVNEIAPRPYLDLVMMHH